jgi:DNA-binding NarL/FixJ family response regulator
VSVYNMTVTIRVAVAGAGEVVSAGLRSLLAQPGLIVFTDGDPRETRPDVIVYDVIGTVEDGAEELETLIATGIPVIALGRPLRPDLAARAVAHGAVVTLPTEATGEDLFAAVLDAAHHDPMSVGIYQVPTSDVRPNRERLTDRETQVLRCVASGRSNRETCEELSLSINTVKSYVRNAYRKIGVTTRPQAIVWCAQHGLHLDPAEEPSG